MPLQIKHPRRACMRSDFIFAFTSLLSASVSVNGSHYSQHQLLGLQNYLHFYAANKIKAANYCCVGVCVLLMPFQQVYAVGAAFAHFSPPACA
jgi:hypothetical protein